MLVRYSEAQDVRSHSHQQQRTLHYVLYINQHNEKSELCK